MAGCAELGNAHLLVVELLLLDDGRLDGHTVVVPAGNVGCVEAAHGLHTNNEVLQRLVERMAHMQVTVGERRAIVQREAGLTLVLLQQLVVDVHLLPAFQHTGFAVGQTGTHGKVCLGKIERFVVILTHFDVYLLKVYYSSSL